MFYSESLLSKTGPLARVWLSANIERKLSKTHILQSSVKDSVDAIVNPDSAPMALRLSGQLLLGVVRIYSRKARYLLDDCNEALMKIKMAFRLTGNNDLPAGLHIPSRDALMIADDLPDGDNLEMPAIPDASFLLAQMQDVNITLSRKQRAGSRDINLQDDFGSQFLQNSIENNKNADEELGLDDVDLDLDFGDDIIETARGGDRSMEMGRDAPTPRPAEDDIFSEMDFNAPLKEKESVGGDDREQSMRVSIANDEGFRLDEDGDIAMGGDDFQFGIGDAPDVSGFAPPAPDPRARISESPLSEIDENRAAEIEAEVHRNEDSLNFEPEEEEETEIAVQRNPAHRIRNRKAIPTDNETQIPSKVIKDQQNDRSKILQPQKFLPRDPLLLALIEMQRNGSFVSNVLGSTRDMAWAPELRGMLSIDAVRRTGDLKRKRDSGVADMSGDEHPAKSPRLEIAEQEEDVFAADGDDVLAGDDTVVPKDNTIISLAGDEGFAVPLEDEEEQQRIQQEEDEGFDAGSPGVNFDETTAPLVHPADSGPISVGTKHAVHLLRERFGPEAADSPNKRKQASVLFQDLLPEATTTKADATKMFFEILVLATKDAIKAEQREGELGADIKVRGKRGLWGDWAEKEAGGEIETQGDEMNGLVAIEA